MDSNGGKAGGGSNQLAEGLLESGGDLYRRLYPWVTYVIGPYTLKEAWMSAFHKETPVVAPDAQAWITNPQTSRQCQDRLLLFLIVKPTCFYGFL